MNDSNKNLNRPTNKGNQNYGSGPIVDLRDVVFIEGVGLVRKGAEETALTDREIRKKWNKYLGLE